MVSVTKYPTVIVSNPGSWLGGVPAGSWILGAHDGSCAYNYVPAGSGDRIINLSTFGFAIPAGSTINNVFIGLHGVIDTAEATPVCYATVKKGSVSVGSNDCPKIFFGDCTDAADVVEVDVQPNLNFTVAELNAESFTFWVAGANVLGLAQAVPAVDDCWLRVVYTEAPPAPAAVVARGLGRGRGRARCIEGWKTRVFENWHVLGESGLLLKSRNEAGG